MKKVLLALALLIGTLRSAAQSNMTDEELKKEIDAHPQQDTFRVNRLIDLSFSLDLNFAERVKIAAEALAVSQKIDYLRGELFALANLGYYESILGNIKEGDSLLHHADSLVKKTTDPELIGIVLFRYGHSITITTGDRKGLDYLLKADEALAKTDNYTIRSYCEGTIGAYYQNNLSNYPLAMKYLLRATSSAEKAGSTSRIINVLTSMGILYHLIGDDSNSLIVLKKAEVEIKSSKGTKGSQYAYLQSVLGEVYRVTGRYQQAIDAYKLAMESETSMVQMDIYESNLADVYTRIDSLSLAFQYAFSSLSIAKKIDDELAFGWIHGILARAYLKKSMPDSSIYFARLGINEATQTSTIEFMRDNTQALANAYAFKKDFDSAYHYHLRYINYRDSMLNTDVKNKTALLQYNYDLDKKQAQITELGQQKKAQQNFLTSALIVLALILLTAILLLRNNRQKQKANKLLQKQKQEIDDKANELSIQKDNVELLGEIGRKITSSLSVEKIIGTAYDKVNSLMDASVFGIGVYNDGLKRIEFPATYENGKALPFYVNSIDDKNRFGPICFSSGKEIIIGDLDTEYQYHVSEVVTPHEGGQPLSVIFLPLIAKEEKLGVITVQSFQKNAYTDYHLYMLRNIAIYTAIALENAESYETLRSTQSQLIQSEKMASLGELTAGIAHEIQNPLNFVNNFSEVNKELLVEMNEEIEKGNYAEVKVLAKDVTENEEKINHHGKRAEGIVKGMLQHSRSSSGVKEPTDINALADEYLRLAYHGLRAKDKSFNATMKTNFDESIGNINIVPQDIGRVILNLITNAFYAVTPQPLKGGVLSPSIKNEPTVWVSTKKMNDKILVSVKDNGPGIPQKILDKIFQPFFTTKPTGQGTGLGLSLSYDIMKAHGGEIKVETKEGEGSEFIIQLPI